MHSNPVTMLFSAKTTRASLVVAVLLFAGCGRSEIDTPRELAGLRLSKVTRGEKAAEIINSLHRAPIVGEKHLVATYGPEGEVTLYVTRFARREEADSQFRRMGQRLRTNPSPFGHYRQVRRQGVDMHSVTGLGQLHYTFVRGRSVYWLAGELTMADRAVNELLPQLRDTT